MKKEYIHPQTLSTELHIASHLLAGSGESLNVEGDTNPHGAVTEQSADYAASREGGFWED